MFWTKLHVLTPTIDRFALTMGVAKYRNVGLKSLKSKQ